MKRAHKTGEQLMREVSALKKALQRHLSAGDSSHRDGSEREDEVTS
jgi:hypothetical protein